MIIDENECIICGEKIDINDLFVCSKCKNKSIEEIKQILSTKGITDKAFWTIMCMHLLGGNFAGNSMRDNEEEILPVIGYKLWEEKDND